jgi:outer membrane protein insertion porin family
LGWTDWRNQFDRQRLLACLLSAMVAALFCFCSPAAFSQLLPTSRPAAVSVVSPELIGRTVEEVRVVGNAQVSSQVILNLARTHEGDKFDPVTVQEDYQRIYGLNRFSNVQAQVEPTRAGVIVIFQVTEQQLIKEIRFVGNSSVSTSDLQKAVNLKAGDAIEPFRIALAKREIATSYRAKNHPFAHAELSMDELTRTGNAVFRIVEGPEVTIRKIAFVGGNSFTYGKLNSQVKTTRWYWIFNAGTYDPEVVEDDVAALRRFYNGNGYFNAHVDRKLIFSPDQSELEIDFLINEGPRFRVDRVSFTGNVSVDEFTLRKNLKLVEGRFFDNDLLQHDVREIVKAYSPKGYIYDPQSDDPRYLRIGKPSYPYVARLIFHDQPGTVEMVYEISEGKPFMIGRILVKGNERSQDKLVLRELHVGPGQLYNSGELADATDRLKGTPYFDNATITPVGDQPDTRDLLVEVHEKRTANISVGAGINSNGGIAGNFTFEQKNFDIANPPSTFSDILSDRAFTGAGQTFRVSFEPGTQVTNASILFSEPYLFDQPYSLTTEAFIRDWTREDWVERYAGGRITLGKQMSYIWSTNVSFLGEDVKVSDITDYAPVTDTVAVINHETGEPLIDPVTGQYVTRLKSPRAPDVLIRAGHNTVTSIGWQLRRDTTNHGPLTYEGTSTTFNFEQFGAMGGEFYFSKFALGLDGFQTVYQDLLDRRTVLGLQLNTGYITRNAPFFERFYGGGIGSLRGFAFRGVSPRQGWANDPVGGDFSLLGSAEVNYPIYGDNLRGVVFTDAGTVEEDIRIHTIRVSVGFGIRLVLPFLGQAPLKLDLGFPLVKRPEDDVQYFSFAFGSSF